MTSDSIFLRASKLDGILDLGFVEGKIMAFMPFKSAQNGVEWSFPVSIVACYDPVLGEKMMGKFLADTYYQIAFKRTTSDYLVLDPMQASSWIEEQFKDKIVICGDLGPELEDVVPTPLDQGDILTFRTLVAANIVSNLLDGVGTRIIQQEQPTTKQPPQILGLAPL